MRVAVGGGEVEVLGTGDGEPLSADTDNLWHHQHGQDQAAGQDPDDQHPRRQGREHHVEDRCDILRASDAVGADRPAERD